MTDLDVLLAADAAAHRFFDEVARDLATTEQANEFAFEAFAALVGEAWWLVDRDQLILFRYHFAVKLLAFGLVRPAKWTPPK